MQIKTTMRYHLKPVRMDLIKKTRHKKCWQGSEYKGINVYCKLIQPQWKKAQGLLKSHKTELPYDLVILLLGINLKKTKSLNQKNICTPMFTVALFIIAKIWKQSKCPATDEWIKKMWYIFTMDITQP